MSPDGRPWWYSGDDEADVEADGVGPAPESPIDGPDSSGPQSERDEATAEGSRIEWTALLAGAQRMMDWATERVMAPHAEHDVPADHPQCVVCRTMVLIGESRSPAAEEAPESYPSADGGPQPDDVVDAATRVRDRQIAWIPIRPGAREP